MHKFLSCKERPFDVRSESLILGPMLLDQFFHIERFFPPKTPANLPSILGYPTL